MANPFSRPEGGWRFEFEGVKTNDTPDAIEAKKSPYAQNIRSTYQHYPITRPGYTQLFTTTAAPITDIRAYSTLGTDNLPRYLVRNVNNQIYLDNGTLLGTLSGSSQGVCFIPYRPGESPQTWMYTGARSDYQKFSAPDANTGLVTQYNVGLQEPAAPPNACTNMMGIYVFYHGTWTKGGTMPTDPTPAARLSDTAGSTLQDPASTTPHRYSVQVTSTKSYQLWMTVVFDASGPALEEVVVDDILPPMNAGVTITIESIRYASGTTGRCVIVPTQGPTSGSIPTFTSIDGALIPAADSVFNNPTLSGLRRGSIVRLDNGVNAENLFVLSVTTGPNGNICFEVTTTYTFAATNNITGIPAISVCRINSAVSGQTITQADFTFTVNTGTGYATQPFNQNSTDPLVLQNPFISVLGPYTDTTQQDDYITFGLQISDISKLTSGRLIFNVDTTVDYITNAFYYDFDATSLVGFAVSSTSLTASAEYYTISFPVNALTRIGNNLTRTLSNCNGVKISLTVTATVSCRMGAYWVGGGGQPDVGLNSPYFYAARGRNSSTGTASNPSPITRYGVSPRRQPVTITVVDTVLDPQMDMWDFYRYGGTVTSWRYIGSTPNTGGGTDTFTDNFFDTSALGGSLIEYDNFQPWPTIDLPYTATSGTVSGVLTTIQVRGTQTLVIYSASSPFTSPAPSNITKWLPGTLVLLGGQTAYTVWTRPASVTLASPPNTYYYAYLFQFVENAGDPTVTVLSILEPNIANQKLPYLWGPDSAGTVFGAGDPFRPGSFYFCKNFTPDSAPDSYNQELTQPSEPVLGGEVLNGLSYAASPKRWWALYPQFGNLTQRYQCVERPFQRGLAAAYGHCTDGKNIYWWAKDGIWVSPGGGQGQSLTEEDLSNIFPHEGVVESEGVPGQDYQYGGYTIYAPNYGYSSLFRLGYCNGYLYADYRNSNGDPCTLVCDVRDLTKPKWSVDLYGTTITCHYGVEQQSATANDASTAYPALILGDAVGAVHYQTDNTNDGVLPTAPAPGQLGQPISGVIATFEYNGGDIREDQLFNDAFLDVRPVHGITATAMQDGTQVQVPSLIPTAAVRIQTNLPVGQELKYMGVMLEWTDDFTLQPIPTAVFAWQPLYQGVPVAVFLWKTQGTSFGLPGYKHIARVNFAYKATADVTLTIGTYDGQSPQAVTLPTTDGELRKTEFWFTANKGMMYFISGQSSGEWQPYLGDCEFYVGAWGRQGSYVVFTDVPGPQGIKS